MIVSIKQWRHLVCVSVSVSPLAFQRAVNREFTLSFTFLSPSLWGLNSWCPFLHVSLSFFSLFSLLALSSSFTRKTHMHTPHTEWHVHPFQFLSPLFCFTPNLQPLFCPLPFYPFPPISLLPSPSVAESTGDSSHYMYSQLLCGHYDNRHEFNMALTYPSGCKPVRMQHFK